MGLGALAGLRISRRKKENETKQADQGGPQAIQMPPPAPPVEQNQWDPAQGQYYAQNQAEAYPPSYYEQQVYYQSQQQYEQPVQPPIAEEPTPQYTVEVVDDTAELNKDIKPEKGADEERSEGGGS